MPFIPPVSIAHSSPSTPVSGGLTGNVRPTMNYNNPSATRTKAPVEDNKGSSMTERLASNLRHLGKKSQPRSRLPTSKATSGSGLNAKCKGQWLSSSSKRLSGTLPASCTGGSISKTPQCSHGSRGSLDSGLVKGEPQVRVTTTTYLEEDEARFTLTLTPEAVLLLQRRSKERQQRLEAWNTEVTSSTTDGRRRRHQPASRHGTLSSRAAVKNSHHNNSDILVPGDVSSLVKISLLNEWHKYDDVEYEEEEEDCVVDERVVLKCTEWLRGLENAPVTVGTAGLQYSRTSLKSF